MRSFRYKIDFLLIRVIAPAIIKNLFFFFPRKEKTLLIVRSDGIGDYILFRNYLHFLKNSKKYRHYKIYLLENLICKDLANYWDSGIIDKFIWYSDGYFLKWKLTKLLFNLQLLRVETVIYSNYSRKFTVDWLIEKVRAKNKIAIDGDCINQTAEKKNSTNRYYSELIKVDPMPLHEFERNRQIFELLTGEKSTIEKPFVTGHKLNLASNNSVVIFPGAGQDSKIWPSENFNTLCYRLLQELKTPVILAGAKDGAKQVFEIQNGITDKRCSCRTDLDIVRLCELIGGAALVIAGDTAVIHIAALLGIPAVCIAKGDHYGRFIPYPREMRNQITCVFPDNYIRSVDNYDQWSPFTINDVRTDDVFNTVAGLLTVPIENKN